MPCYLWRGNFLRQLRIGNKNKEDNHGRKYLLHYRSDRRRSFYSRLSGPAITHRNPRSGGVGNEVICFLLLSFIDCSCVDAETTTPDVSELWDVQFSSTGSQYHLI